MLPFRNPPYHMDRFPILIFLKQQYARSLWVIRIFFYESCLFDRCKNIFDKNILLTCSLISMLGYSYIFRLNQIKNRLQ